MGNIHKFHHDGGWSSVPNKLLEAPELSWKAKGVWAYIYSRPDGWEVQETDLIRRAIDGRDGVRAALRELEEHGYISRVHTRERGRFSTVTYKLHLSDERPPMTEKPSTEKPSPENPTLSNTEESKKENHSSDRASLVREGGHWLSIYPERDAPLPSAAVIRNYIRLRESGVSEQDLIDAVVNYAYWCKKNDRIGTRYVYSPMTFLAEQWKGWVDRKPQADTITSTDGFRYIR
jgi:hypothetical protein